MEFPRRGQSSHPTDGGDDDDDRRRRFPDSTPPSAREPSPAPAQGDAVTAALGQRREDLLWELHKTKIHREMLLCQLVETERAMAARLAAARGHPATPATPPLPWPQGDLLPAREYAWWSTPWEEQAHAHAHGALAARSGDQEITPWWRRSPSAVTTPVYPHVERSPSPPIARGWPTDDDERQERGEPPGSPAMAPPVRHAPHVEQSTPVPIKEPAAEADCMPSGSPAMDPTVQPAPNVEQSTSLPAKEPAAVAKVEADAVVQTGANADADQVLLGKGATPGGQGCIGQEGEEGDIAINGHGRQLLGEMNVSKSTEQPKPIESISGGQTDELVPKRYQDNKPADQEIATLDEQKRVGSNDELTPERRSSGVKRQLAAGASPAKKPRSQGSSITCSLCKVTMTSPRALVEHRASLLHRSNLTPLQSGITCSLCKVTMTSPRALVEHRASLLHRSNLAPLRSGNKAITEAAQPAEKKTEKPETPELNSSAHHHQSWMYYCGICEVRCSSEKTMASHLAGKRHRERHNSNFIFSPNVLLLHCAFFSSLAAFHPALLFSTSPSPTPRHGAAAAGRSITTETIPAKKPSPSEKSEPVVQTTPMPPSAWSCAVCQVRTTSERNLRDHCGGQKHQSNVAALEKTTKAMAKTTAKPSPNAARWGCSICHISCNGEWDFDTHLKGKKHQANTQALLEQSKKNSGNPESQGTKAAVTLICRVCHAQFTCQPDLQSHLKVMKHQLNLRAPSPDGSSFTSETSESSSVALALYACNVCSVKCTGERTLAYHLTGKKHLKLEKLQAFCEICKLQCNSEKMLSDHRYGKKHKAKLEKVLQAKVNAKE